MKYLDNSSIAERINIASGNVFKTSSLHRVGVVPQMSNGQTGSVWDVNDTTYPWEVFDSAGAGPLVVQAGDVADSGSSLTIVGLDSNYDLTEETLTLSTSTQNTTRSYIRLLNAEISNGSPNNTGNITLRRVNTIVGQINAGNGTTLMATYTVPNGWTAFPLQGISTITKAADASGSMYVRAPNEQSFHVRHAYEVSGDGGPCKTDFVIPFTLHARTDIDIRISVRTNNARVTCIGDYLLKKE